MVLVANGDPIGEFTKFFHIAFIIIFLKYYYINILIIFSLKGSPIVGEIGAARGGHLPCVKIS